MSEPETPRAASSAEEIEAAHVGVAPRLDGPVVLREYDARWPEVFAREARAIDERLGAREHHLEHVGSTAVPGLLAKPVVDMLLTVVDPADEVSYVPALAPLGFRLVVREPEWYAHRVLRKYRPEGDELGGFESLNLHVLPAGCAEVQRMLRFRERLRTDEADRERYAEVKRGLARRHFTYMQNYADAKSEVVDEILARAGGGE